LVDWDKCGSPTELAERLWDIDSLDQLACLSPDRFRTLFDRVYQQTDELHALWQLGGATTFYLQRNPGAFAVPTELPRQLLSSPHVDARVIGLKLLILCPVLESEITEAIVQALDKRDAYESCGGIHELNKFLDTRLQASGKLDHSLAARLSCALKPLVDDGEEVHSGARRALAFLNEITA
jgi:hypothetical protein